MCGIAYVLQGVQIECSSCSKSLNSYQQDCGSCGSGDEESGADVPIEIGPSINDLVKELRRRGPDEVRSMTIPLPFPSPSGSMLHMIGAELQLRGSQQVQQPLEDRAGNVLVFNGEVFGGLSVELDENDAQKLLEALQSACTCSPIHASQDTQQGQVPCHQCHRPTVVQIVSRLSGPWALAYFHRASQTLWYGRDFVGRRSLVAHLPNRQDERLIISSVAVSRSESEVDGENGSLSNPKKGLSSAAGNAFEVNGTSRAEETKSSRGLNKETGGVAGDSGLSSYDTPEEGEALFDFWVDVPSGIYSVDLRHGAHRKHFWTDLLVRHLCRWERYLVVPPLESHVAAPGRREAGKSTAGARNGVSNGQSEERKTSCKEEKVLYTRERKSVEDDKSGELEDFQEAAELLLEALSRSVAKRVTGIRTRSKCRSEGYDDHVKAERNQLLNRMSREGGTEEPALSDSWMGDAAERARDHADVAVLFSGGLDSMVLAALADRHVAEAATIDLINVCFDGGKSPDRQSALAGLKELESVAPRRRWRLIAVDSSLAEVDRHKKRLLHLICPSQTYMDLNIGAALWLAARGQGTTAIDGLEETSIYGSELLPINGSDDGAEGPSFTDPGLFETARIQPSIIANPSISGHIDGSKEGDEVLDTQTEVNRPPNHEEKRSGSEEQKDPDNVKGQLSNVPTQRRECASSARVLLVGSGADEQCAGYGRHRTKFRSGGWQLLDAEMRLDVLRLWQRNLGRDDRCIADHGKEARFPFLDEDVMALLLSFPLWIIADLREPLGVGDKALLREVARKLGLRNAAALPKRAIQFGSRIARASNRRDFGSNRAANLSSAGAVSFRNAPLVT